MENEVGMENARQSSDRPAAVSSSGSSAPSMLFDLSSGSETIDTDRCTRQLLSSLLSLLSILDSLPLHLHQSRLARRMDLSPR